MEEWVKTILLGVVEGVTEFLPISSTGHLLIVSQLLRFRESVGGTFEIFIQLGAVIAVLGFYGRDLLGQARSVMSTPDVRRFWLAVLVAFLPAAVIGLAARDFVKTVLFPSPAIIAWSFIIGGIVLIVVERIPRRSVTKDVTSVRWQQALVIGLAQATALVPGVSRSGASMVGGLLVGLDRPAATNFAFYLAMPTLGAATIYELLRSLRSLQPSDFGFLLVGLIISGIVAALSIGWLLRYVAHHSFVPFGIYRIVVGALILLLVSLQIL